MRRALATGCIAVLVLAGCGSDDNPTAPAPNGVPGDFFRLWQTSYVDGAAFFTGIDDGSGQMITMDVNGLAVGAVLLNVNGRYVDGGTVRIGQSPPLASTVDTLARRSVPVNGTPWFLYTSVPHLPAQPPVAFDGVVWHHFITSGSADFPAFRDSIRSITRPTVSEPATGAIVSRASDLIVSWDAGSDPDIHVLCFLESSVDSTLAPGREVPDPDGTTRIEGVVLSALPPGPARLSVVRYRERRVSHGGPEVRLKCEGITLRLVTVQ